MKREHRLDYETAVRYILFKDEEVYESRYLLVQLEGEASISVV